MNANNFIEWTGDPYSARVNLEAQYLAKRVNYAPLAQLPGVDPNIASARSDVYVVAKLTGELFRPTINFDLDFPASSPAASDPGLSFALQQVEEDKNAMYKQVEVDGGPGLIRGLDTLAMIKRKYGLVRILTFGKQPFGES